MNPIDEFLKTKGEVTQKNYRWVLNQYFREIKQNPENYFKQKRNFKGDIERWWNDHIDEVPKTRNTKLGIVRGFFEEYPKIISTLPPKFFKKLRKMKKGSRASTLDRVPTPEEFKSMLAHGTIKDRALFLFLLTSGMRIGEVLKLRLSERFIKNLEHDPPKIDIPAPITKTGNPRYTFITPEVKDYLLEWLKIRKQYIKTAIKKSGHIAPKKENDDRVFPFSYDVCWRSWLRLLNKTGLTERDETTNNYILHIHTLRKYFLSQLKLEIPVVIPEALAGHEEYLDEAYKRYSEEQLSKYYKKGMHRLTVFDTTSKNIKEVNEQMEKLQDDNIKLKDELAQMKAMVTELRLKQLERLNGTKKEK